MGYSLPEYLDSKFQIPGVNMPGQSADLKNMLAKQISVAKDYRSKLPQIGQDLYEGYSQGARKNLAQGIKDVRSDYNRRGLLHSGKRQGAEYQKQADTASDLANQRYSINSALLNNADSLENQALTTGYNLAGANPNLGTSALAPQQQQIENQIFNNKQNQQAAQTIGNVAGTFGGLLAGRAGSGNTVSGYGPTASGSNSGIGSLGAYR